VSEMELGVFHRGNQRAAAAAIFFTSASSLKTRETELRQ
jgi:hypothetical protein